ncbi:unnamed protein product [Polarella glacialis]|uniref:Protein-S-isoprenylcysteine O-methyltransferase n=1 Tax=Polarella glacialis TaxID=89957 RepID=A0A813EYD6_POLGL|nr:unnamed protein product [Polarella glacialis]
MAPPQLTVGMPFDATADIPIFPPAATLLAVVLGLLLHLVTGRRFRWMPKPLQSLDARLALLVALLAMTKALMEVAGSALVFPYNLTRNPLYCSLLLILMPSAAALFDSAWPLFFAPLLWGYLHFVVISAEERLLVQAFGAQFEAYKEEVPRWILL